LASGESLFFCTRPWRQRNNEPTVPQRQQAGSTLNNNPVVTGAWQHIHTAAKLTRVRNNNDEKACT